VPVAIQRDGDARVAEEDREGLRVDAGGDEVAGAGMPTLVEADGREPGDGLARARWRQAQREIELTRNRIAERGMERTRALLHGAEVALER
jgi:hypothetical protein